MFAVPVGETRLSSPEAPGINLPERELAFCCLILLSARPVGLRCFGILEGGCLLLPTRTSVAISLPSAWMVAKRQLFEEASRTIEYPPNVSHP